ncbi:hypothetical protein AB0I60_29275 [Actinosynnema sp. NPDC050436]|uniref:hypothetical protein n=1 Tax=Actinosynnema sp. NPDC050436 TaxID=3155659 RepID=UPI0033FC9145
MSERTGGIESVFGESVQAVTDPTGPTNLGGTQFNINSALIATAVEARSVRRSPRVVAEDRLRSMEERFVAPPNFGPLRTALHRPGAVLLSGAPGTGRRTAAMMLLHSSGDGTARFRELPDEDSERSEKQLALLDPDAVEAGERLLLDLTAEAEWVVRTIRRDLGGYLAAVGKRGAYAVVVLSMRTVGLLPGDLGESVVEIGRPDARAVLQRHLRALDVDGPVVDVPDLAQHLDADPMSELARLARLVRDTKAAAGGRGSLREWLTDAVSAMSLRVDEVARKVRENPDGRFRALLLATACFEQSRVEVVHHATESLLRVVDYPEDEAHPWDRPDLAESLGRIDARTDGERRVRFGSVTYGQAVRTHFWDSLPGQRSRLRTWLEIALPHESVPHRDRVRVLRRFSAECLRVNQPDHLFWLVERWNAHERASELVPATAPVLLDGVTNPRHGAVFRKQVYNWACSRSLTGPLAGELVRLSAEAIAPTRPDQALVRLRHLSHNPVVQEYARNTLVGLSDEDPRFLRRVLHRAVQDVVLPRPREGDLLLFTALADPERLLKAPRPLLADDFVRAQVVEGAHRVMAARPHEWWAPWVRRWLAAHDPARDVVLDLLVDATGNRSDLEARLVAVARAWALIDPAHRAVAAELLRRIDRALAWPSDEPKGLLR